MPPISIKAYLFLWQLPVFAAFAAAWLIGGTYLTRRALGACTDLPRSKLGTARCLRLNFLATGAGLVALLIIATFFATLAKRTRTLPLLAGVAVIGLPAMLAMTWIVLLNLLDLPRKTVLRITATTAGPVLAVLVVLAGATAVPTWFLGQARRMAQGCTGNLRWVEAGLGEHARREGHEAPNLEALIDRDYIEEKYLRCPANPTEEIAYVYAPRPAGSEAQGGSRILLCDRDGNHGGRRIALFANGNIEEINEDRFAELLKLPENQQLAEQLGRNP